MRLTRRDALTAFVGFLFAPLIPWKLVPSVDTVIFDEIQIEGDFPSGLMMPPFHPNCRCVLLYKGEPVTEVHLS